MGVNEHAAIKADLSVVQIIAEAEVPPAVATGTCWLA